MTPSLEVVSRLAVGLGIVCAVVVAVDLLRGPRPRMAIMNVVWPVTALWAGPLGLWAYFRFGRTKEEPSFPVAVAKGAAHCGSGCALGDLIAELVFFVAPFTLFGHRIFGSWVYDFVAAFALGILFQYFTIKPMRHLSRREGLVAAVEADTASLVAWQVGMYGWMAIVTFVLVHHELRPTTAFFWFNMQIGMLAGFLTSYPVNWWLLRAGVKEAM